MVDRDTVVKALQCRANRIAGECRFLVCDYGNMAYCDTQKIMRDALELIDNPEERIAIMTEPEAKESVSVECWSEDMKLSQKALDDIVGRWNDVIRTEGES